MTIILDTIKIYSDFMYICSWGNFSHVHPILTQSTYIEIPRTYVLAKALPMCLLFYHYIWQSCSEVVATLVIHVINQIMNGWRLTESVLYSFQYGTLKYNYIENQSFKYWYIFFIWQLFVFHLNQINQIRHIQLHYEALSIVNIPLICFFLILWHTTHVFMYA
jgi:hypothetical protein